MMSSSWISMRWGMIYRKYWHHRRIRRSCIGCQGLIILGRNRKDLILIPTTICIRLIQIQILLTTCMVSIVVPICTIWVPAMSVTQSSKIQTIPTTTICTRTTAANLIQQVSHHLLLKISSPTLHQHIIQSITTTTIVMRMKNIMIEMNRYSITRYKMCTTETPPKMYTITN